MERATVRVDGVVQSVGFRPFVYRTAVDFGLRGTVRNLGDAGVRVELEGAAGDVDAFLTALREDAPPLARVETVEVDREPADGAAFEGFDIVASSGGDGGGGTIPPDTAMCDACLADLRDPDSRYSDYWATSCVDCGPRFTVVESLPYDRPATSMAAFPMCDDCRTEYEAPADRRYHAQTIACPRCGPTLRYGTVTPDAAGDATGNATARDDPSTATEMRAAGRDPFPDSFLEPVDGGEAVAGAAEAIRAGDVVVVKGIGGAHLACDATDGDAVARLRERTGRPRKPFAVMAPDADAVDAVADVAEGEREALTAPGRPILLLDERPRSPVATGVAPGLHTVGVMLPYSGVHHLLFDHLDAPLVLTSANLPGRPMLVENGTIVPGLADVADGFLLHDRRIVARCDDSVARVVDGDRRLLRRSRGHAPTPVTVPGAAENTSVLGLGPELDVTAAVLDGEDCYLTQHVGDADDIATLEYLGDAVDHLLSITGLDHPDVVAHDLHPAFNTTGRARRLEREARSASDGVREERSDSRTREGRVDERVAVQHHHAHAASVLAEHDRDAAVAITVDGAGYGPDGTVWGGEVLDATLSDYERVAGLAPVAMPGGDRATRYPGRMAAGVLHARDPGAVADVLARHDVPFPAGDEERDVVVQQLDAGVNTPTTTSAGRFLDATSALVGACGERTYEGEPAMKLEALALDGEALDVEPPTATAGGRPVLDAPALFARLVDGLEDGAARADVAATAQDALARGLADLAVDAARRRDRDAVALTGGVAYNDHVATRVRERVTDAGLTFLGNERVPPGDGGVAFGQVVVAATRSS